ncbi:helix-turn-helix domain-containing protein [Neobacillus mesonae]|uniref:DNA-binding protein n=1 Tax=Neobacillus mesonae TaxID=1193713 RepID=A0A3T0HZ39_9BACI|nr:helix-turn-helix domain-containing protein [Neobacillus mesonae]AZU62392.1 DNA-binding protein [Neobacillus mesonae]
MKQSTYLIGSLILSISILISAFMFSNIYSKSANGVNNSQTTTTSIPDLMTKKQLSEYLQISQKSIDNIILSDDSERAKLGSYDTYQFIPYLKISNQERFLKAEIDKWLQYKTGNH